MADRNELVRQFVNITGIDHDRAQFHLESAAWNLELATANFFEEGEHEVDQGSAANPLRVDEHDDVDDLELEDHSNPPAHLSVRATKPKKSPKPKSRFATIGSLQAEEGSDSSEDEGQAFYAGGSERSGQQVLGPSKKKKDTDNLVKDLFQSAREHGAEELDRLQVQTHSGRPAFQGTGYRLGETEGPLESVAGPSLSSIASSKRPEVQMTLKMWKKGFSVDDGELRPYDDPANKDFLDSISRGEVPQELLRMSRGGEVNLNMEDHRTEDFVKPKSKVKIFSGEGHMLGSPAPAVVMTKASGPSSVTQSAPPPPPKTDVDSSKPSTTIQIRLADGQRLVAKFNLSHTISDIRHHIVAFSPQYAAAPFALMTTFPNKELTDESQTLEQAKLHNAVIVQRLK